MSDITEDQFTEDQFTRAALKATTNEPYLRALEAIRKSGTVIRSFTNHRNSIMSVLAIFVILILLFFIIPIIIVGAIVKSSDHEKKTFFFCILLIAFIVYIKKRYNL